MEQLFDKVFGTIGLVGAVFIIITLLTNSPSEPTTKHYKTSSKPYCASGEWYGVNDDMCVVFVK